MNKSWIVGAAIGLLSVSVATAQQAKEVRSARQEVAVVKAREAVVNDKSDLNILRKRKANDKYNEDRPGVRSDRKAIKKTELRLVKDRAKRDVAKVKKAL